MNLAICTSAIASPGKDETFKFIKDKISQNGSYCSISTVDKTTRKYLLAYRDGDKCLGRLHISGSIKYFRKENAHFYRTEIDFAFGDINLDDTYVTEVEEKDAGCGSQSFFQFLSAEPPVAKRSDYSGSYGNFHGGTLSTAGKIYI